MLQETLLAEPQLSSLNLSDDFSYAQTPALRKPGNVSGRSSGGLAIYWKNFSSIVVTPLLINERIIEINLHYGGVRCVVLKVYMNCDYGGC